VQGWKGPGQKVVLFQCIAGADRTGSVSMAYWMKYKGMSLAQAA
jgi:protein-tyrosine phosphatase